MQNIAIIKYATNWIVYKYDVPIEKPIKFKQYVCVVYTP